jgi:hypothetical protein
MNSTQIKTSINSNLILKNNRVMNSSDLEINLQSEAMIFENNVFENLHAAEPLLTIASSSSLALSRLSFATIGFSSHALFHLILSESFSLERIDQLSFSRIQGLNSGGGQPSQALLKISGQTATAETPLTFSSLSVDDLVAPQQSSFKMMIIDDC